MNAEEKDDVIEPFVPATVNHNSNVMALYQLITTTRATLKVDAVLQEIERQTVNHNSRNWLHYGFPVSCEIERLEG